MPKFKSYGLFDKGQVENDEKRMLINLSRFMGEIETMYNENNDAQVPVYDVMRRLERILEEA